MAGVAAGEFAAAIGWPWWDWGFSPLPHPIVRGTIGWHPDVDPGAQQSDGASAVWFPRCAPCLHRDKLLLYQHGSAGKPSNGGGAMTDSFEDRFKGVLFGQAVGDALGLGAEFMSREQVRDRYPSGLTSYDQIIRDAHRKRWRQGDWTDDTEQMTLIVDSLLECKAVDICDIAQRLMHWEQQGGVGIGMTVYAVLHHPRFLFEPHLAAEEVWESTDRWVAANGAVMRTAALGLWEYQDESKVIANAEKICKITHFDPRCIASCAAVCVAIRRLILGEKDIESLIAAVAAIATDYDSRVVPFFDAAQSADIAALNLEDEETMGYTLRTLSAGIWALRFAPSFEEGIETVIYEGGDADTNASVAGALLGARFGYDAIPRRWIEGLTWRRYMDRVAEELYVLCTTG